MARHPPPPEPDRGDAPRRSSSGSGMPRPRDDGSQQPASRPGGDAVPTPPPRAASPSEDSTHDELLRPPVPITQQLGRVFVVVLAVLFGVFAVSNAQYVDFSWVFGATEVVRGADGERLRGGVPLIVLLVASFALGALVSGFAVWQIKRARAHRRAVLDRGASSPRRGERGRGRERRTEGQ